MVGQASVVARSCHWSSLTDHARLHTTTVLPLVLSHRPRPLAYHEGYGWQCKKIELCARMKRGTASFIAFDIYTREGDTKGVAKSHVRTWGSCRGTSLGERQLESSQQLLTFHNTPP